MPMHVRFAPKADKRADASLSPLSVPQADIYSAAKCIPGEAKLGS